MHGLRQLFRIKVRQTPIEKKHLPRPLLQMNQRLGPAAGLFNPPRPRKQAIENTLANNNVGTGHKNVFRRAGCYWKSCHTAIECAAGEKAIRRELENSDPGKP